MSNYLVGTVRQKLELRSFKVFYDILDDEYAQTIMDVLDRSGKFLFQYFGLTSEPNIEVYLYPDPASFKEGTKHSLATSENIRLLYDENLIFLCTEKLPKFLDDEISKSMGYLLFYSEAKDRELALKQYRTPSWLREGLCMQISVRVRSDSREFLLAGWTQLQEAEKEDKLIKLNILSKNIALIPDPVRRNLAFAQSFFMVKFLNTIYPEKFFKRYATLMSVIEDMDGETVFQQITGNNLESFSALFKEWVHTTNIWAAVGD